MAVKVGGKTLVAVASRHGSTSEIAVAIAEELRNAGLDVELHDVSAVTSLEGYAAVVLGSAAYMGGWLADARKWVERHRERLTTMPVWLFTSGPIGPEAQPNAEPRDLAALLAQSGAREHRVFGGKLDRADLGPGERLAVRIVHAPDGDFRDWEAIRGWAQEIASVLIAQESVGVGAASGRIPGPPTRTD